MKNERITKVSADAHEGRAKGSTDWSRIDKLSDADIEQAMRDDPDWAGIADFDWSNAQLVRPSAKTMISIRLDDDVLRFFKAGGAGYQKRINAVLRSYMRHRHDKATGRG